MKTSLSSQPRPRSSANPGRQLRYRIWSTLTLTDEIVRVRQAQIDQVAGVSVGLGNKLPFILKTWQQEAEVCRGSGDACSSRPLGVRVNVCESVGKVTVMHLLCHIDLYSLVHQP